MNSSILTENEAPVNTQVFLRASDGSILLGSSVAEALAHQASHSHKVKGFITYAKTSVKFYNGSIKTVDVSEDQYDNFVNYLKATGWQLRPEVTSGGFTATRAN